MSEKHNIGISTEYKLVPFFKDIIALIFDILLKDGKLWNYNVHGNMKLFLSLWYNEKEHIFISISKKA